MVLVYNYVMEHGYYIDVLIDNQWHNMTYGPISIHTAYGMISFSARYIDKDIKSGIIAIRIRRV
jgi:hypothetical protein